jgi:hypothetical protein
MGALTENHRCPRVAWVGHLTNALITFGIGAVIGGIVVYAMVERPAGALVLASAALGAVLAGAVRQAAGGPHG